MSERNINMSILISVVVPVFNRQNHLNQVVETVFAQKLTQNVNIELILVDDGSQDDSAKTILALAKQDSRVIPVILPNNQGGGAARNAGIDQARGEWIAFLDSDDLWMPEKLEKQLSMLPGADESVLCFTNLVVDFDDGETPLPWNTIPFAANASPKQYLLEQHQVIQTSTILMASKAAKAVRFNPALRRHQDIDFVLRCESAGVRFVYQSECLVRYSADPKATRVSKRVNAKPSIAWLDVARAYLTTTEIDAFYLRHVFDMHFKDAPLKAISTGLTAVKSQKLPALKLVFRIIKLLIPSKFKSTLKRICLIFK